MKQNLVKTIRLKDSESIELGVLAYELTKKNIMNGINVIYKESDLVHFLIENKYSDIDVNDKGQLIFKK
ncbi:hypothetical protein AB7W40_03335 [Providencia rettgeri]